MAKTMLPEIRRRMRDRDGIEITDYGDVSRVKTLGAGGAPGGALGGGGFGGPLAVPHPGLALCRIG
jgi:hypothetical protein